MAIIYEDQTQKNTGDRLIHVASSGNLSEVEALIAAGVDVNITDEYGNTALIVAARYGHTTVSKQLIDAKADVNRVDKYGNTALNLAAWNGHTAIVEQLTEGKVDVNYVSEYPNRYTALTLASGNGHAGIAKKLLEKHADVRHVEKDGETALSRAAAIQHKPLVIMLFEVGGLVDYLFDMDLMGCKFTLNEVITVININLNELFDLSSKSNNINGLVKKINDLTVRLEGDNFYFKKTREEVKSHLIGLVRDKFNKLSSSIEKDEYNTCLSRLEYIRSHLQIIQEDEVKKEIESLISKFQPLIEAQNLLKEAKGLTTKLPSKHSGLFSTSTPKVSKTRQQINNSSRIFPQK